jgi:hypothetical protein
MDLILVFGVAKGPIESFHHEGQHPRTYLAYSQQLNVGYFLR